MMNPVVVQKYFNDLETIIEDLNLKDRPDCIWNFDVTGRSFEHNPVYCHFGEKSQKRDEQNEHQ